MNAFLMAIKSEKSPLDFNKLIPQPQGIQDPRPGILSEGERVWNIENWGTKWNAYSVQVRHKTSWGCVTIYFETAWNCPLPVLGKLMEMYPEYGFELTTACEGGWFAGHIQCDEGEESKLERNWWTSENDPGGHIRAAIFSALKA